nr:MAG TPA: hypothetical protein [Caudoviricetes sp.]
MENQNIEQISPKADNQIQQTNIQFNNAEKVKQMAVSDINMITNLVETGVMTQEQGQNLMNYVTKRAFEKYIASQPSDMPKEAPVATSTISPQQQVPQNVPMPDFFNKDGRLDVYDYLKNSEIEFDDGEISKISELVEKIENSAVERYLKEKEHEKALNNENEFAKQRLRANAQNTTSDGLKNLVFTREQIGKMSGAEFAKHERAIMDQLKKGLIK